MRTGFDAQAMCTAARTRHEGKCRMLPELQAKTRLCRADSRRSPVLTSHGRRQGRSSGAARRSSPCLWATCASPPGCARRSASCARTGSTRPARFLQSERRVCTQIKGVFASVLTSPMGVSSVTGDGAVPYTEHEDENTATPKPSRIRRHAAPYRQGYSQGPASP
jgi:hypothetical protein